MTDNDIIKALECCRELSLENCKACPYYSYGHGCLTTCFRDTLDLINRQKAENKALQKQMAEQKAEIEEQDQAIINALKRMGQIRAEAITEFEEKVVSCGVKSVEIGYFDNNSYEFITIRKDKFDQIAKEMKGDVNNA